RHPPGIARVEPHPLADSWITPRDRRQRRADRVLGAGGKGRDARAGPAVVLVPVAVPAAPHLVDATLGNARAELRLVVDDGYFRQVVHLPARLLQAELEIDLFGVEEEALVEEPDLLERLASGH